METLARIRQDLRMRPVWIAAFAVLTIIGAGRSAAAQNESPAPKNREDFEVSVFTGISIDSFAAKELRKYLNKNDSGGVSEQLIIGLDFQYRVAGDPDASRQVWLYG